MIEYRQIWARNSSTYSSAAAIRSSPVRRSPRRRRRPRWTAQPSIVGATIRGTWQTSTSIDRKRERPSMIAWRVSPSAPSRSSKRPSRPVTLGHRLWCYAVSDW